MAPDPRQVLTVIGLQSPVKKELFTVITAGLSFLENERQLTDLQLGFIRGMAVPLPALN